MLGLGRDVAEGLLLLYFIPPVSQPRSFPFDRGGDRGSHTHTYTYVCTHTQAHTHTCAHTCARIYTCTCACIHIHTHSHTPAWGEKTHRVSWRRALFVLLGFFISGLERTRHPPSEPMSFPSFLAGAGSYSSPTHFLDLLGSVPYSPISLPWGPTSQGPLCPPLTCACTQGTCSCLCSSPCALLWG